MGCLFFRRRSIVYCTRRFLPVFHVRGEEHQDVCSSQNFISPKPRPAAARIARHVGTLNCCFVRVHVNDLFFNCSPSASDAVVVEKAEINFNDFRIRHRDSRRRRRRNVVRSRKEREWTSSSSSAAAAAALRKIRCRRRETWSLCEFRLCCCLLLSMAMSSLRKGNVVDSKSTEKTVFGAAVNSFPSLDSAPVPC